MLELHFFVVANDGCEKFAIVTKCRNTVQNGKSSLGSQDHHGIFQWRIV